MGSGGSQERLVGGDSLHAYRRSLAHVKVLSREAERDLACALGGRRQARGLQARRSVCRSSLRSPTSIAARGRPHGGHHPAGETSASSKAAAKFDPTRECRLATYAAYWIRAEIREYVMRAFRVVRLGTTKAERRALRTYRKTKCTDAAELARESGLSEERVRTLLPLMAARRDEPRRHAARRRSCGGTDRRQRSLTGRRRLALGARASGRRRRHGRGLALDERERMIVHERFMKEEPPTLQELGARLGVSKRSACQLEERARTKLRGELRELADLVA